MSKAIQGAAEIGAAVGFFAAAAFVPGAAFLVGGLAVDIAMAGVGVMGIGMEAGAIASVLTANRGENITTRQPASPRQIVYGVQRVGGVEVFYSTTGSEKDQLNLVVVLASHEVWAIQNLYLDGRQCYWAGSGDGYTVQNGYGFGGGCDGNSHTGPDGSQYTFDNGSSGHSGVFAVARYGNQAVGDYVGELTANDSRWGPATNGTPTGLGCTYFYLKIEYDSNLFPDGIPEIKATVSGKLVFDPRSGETTYSENWALIVADILTDPVFGLGDTVNQDQLIAAANICDELVTYSGAGGGTEARYTCHYHYDTSISPGSVLQTLMTGAAGRISYIAGEWFIFPGAYVSPSASFDQSNLIDKPTWSPKRKYRDLFNTVQGSYTAPNYPYSAATAPGSLSDEYDTNGYYNGQIQNNFPFAFQASSYPSYSEDTDHGYPANQWLEQDGNIQLVKTLDIPSSLSVTQCQRLAKIELLRNRWQGTGQLIMGPEALILQPNDTFTLSFPQRGWVNKLLEVNSVDWYLDNSNGVLTIKVAVGVNETDPSVYTWLAQDELTVYCLPANPDPVEAYTTAPPTNVVLESDSSTALIAPDGTVTARIQVTWDTPSDIRVVSIQVQYQLSGATAWTDAGTVSVDSNIMFIAPILSGQTYNVQICSVQGSGATSVWVEPAAVYCPPLTSIFGTGSLPSGVVQGSLGTNVNLVPDSNLQFGWTYWSEPAADWTIEQVISTANPDPASPAPGCNAFVIPAASNSGRYYTTQSAAINLTAGSQFTLSAFIDAYYVTSGSPVWLLYDSTITIEYASLVSVPGATGRIDTTFIFSPAGVAAGTIVPVVLLLDTSACIFTNSVLTSAPMIQPGNTMTAYLAGIASLDSAAGLLHGTMSAAVQQAVTPTGTVTNLGGVTASDITPVSTLVTAGSSSVLNKQGNLTGYGDLAFTYTSTSTTIVVSWSAFDLYQNDGAITAVTSGSYTFTGLTASTAYDIGCSLNIATLGLDNWMTGATVAGDATTFSQQILITVLNADGQVNLLAGGPGAQATTASAGGGTGGGGGGTPKCPAVEMYVQAHAQVGSLTIGASVDCADGEQLVESFDVSLQPCTEVTTAAGHVLITSDSTPFVLPDGSRRLAGAMDGQLVLTDRGHDTEKVWMTCSAKPAGLRNVGVIFVGDRIFAAGADADKRIYSHNQKIAPTE